RAYFNIASLDLIPQVHHAIFRISDKQPYSKYAISAWIEKGRKEAIQKKLASFEKDKIKNCLNSLKQLTLLDQNDFLSELEKICLKCGIALVVLPYLSKTRINGVVYWLDSKTVLIQLSNRYKYTDIFWFSFFHELGHAILHGKKKIFLEDNEQKNRFEFEADYFAANTLISKTSYNRFVKSISTITEKSIFELADENSISPGIVVGRLEHDNLVSRGKFTYLKTKLDLN
ncbi:ImmA/IrrE family metallo-endopeptidase, partial [bacterium]|nr:ImmA/IrrE family metallo-endopeptidase [bacterium]